MVRPAMLLAALGTALALAAAPIAVQHAAGNDSTAPALAPQPTLTDAVRDKLRTKYVRRLDRDELGATSVRGLLDGLDDPYTVYLPESEYAALRAGAADEYVGVGLRVAEAPGGLRVVGS